MKTHLSYRGTGKSDAINKERTMTRHGCLLSTGLSFMHHLQDRTVCSVDREPSSSHASSSHAPMHDGGIGVTSFKIDAVDGLPI